MPSSQKAAIVPDPIHSALKNSDHHSLSTLKLLALLVEETSDILTAADVNFKPITWNKASEKIYGLKAEQVIGRELREFIFIHYPNSNRKEVREIIQTKGEWRGEASFTRPTDQKAITLLMCFKQLKEESGNLLGYLISAIDITERKEAESRLRESEQRFKDMADSSPAMIWLSDENDNTVYVNKKWIEFTGQNISNDPNGWSSLIHPEDRDKTIAAYYKGVNRKEQVTTVYRLRRADGTYRWVHDISVPRFLSNGKFVGYIGSVTDIEVERQKHEELVYQSTILENVTDIVVTTDIDFTVKSWNKIAEENYGVSEREAVGKSISDLVKFNFYRTTREEAFIELDEKGIWKGEVSIEKDGSNAKYFLHTVKKVANDEGNTIGYLSMGRDITAKRLAEEKLRESEQFYRTLIADSLDGMILLNTEGLITFASPSVKNVLYFEAEELVGKKALEFVHPDDAAWAGSALQKEMDENPEVKFITVRLLKKNGQWLWCNVRGHNLLSNPLLKSVVVYFHDDTLRKQAKDALQESENRFRTLIRDLQVGVFLCDGDGKIMMCNKAFTQMLSSSEEWLIGRRVYEVLSADVINEQNEFVSLEQRPLVFTLQTKQTMKNVVIGILHPLTKERTWMITNCDPILDAEGNIKYVVCSAMDITERKKMEEELISGQIAHQRQLTQATIDGQENERKEIGKELHDNIGQQLTTIKLFLDFAKTTADENTAEMVNMALKAVSDVINDVRAMSRSLVPSTLKDLGLIESINELIDSLTRAKILKVEFDHLEFDENILPENQKLTLFRIVQEQLNNIVKHACANIVNIRLCSTAQEFILEIKDDGNGFDEKKIRKGLGIINIKSRAELFNGRATISSLPGQGCALIVCFPVPASFIND